MKRRTSLEFRTRQQRSRAGIKKFTVILLAVLVVGGGLSALLFMRNYNYDLKNAFGDGTPTEETTEAPKRDIPETRYDVLLYSISSDRTRTDFLCLMRIRLPENKITLYPFSPSDRATVNGQTATYAEFLKNGGGPALMEAVKAQTGIPVSDYIGSTEDKFKAVVDRYGGFEFTVNEGITFRGDEFTLVLPQGTQNLRGDLLLKYFRYLTYHTQNGFMTQGELLTVMLRHFLNPGTIESMQTIFAYLANHLTSNISIVTFSEASANLTSLMECENIQYITVQTPEDYLNS